MKIIDKDYCSRCKTGPAEIAYSKGKPNKNGTIIQYYHCRECNRNRFKKYYHDNKDKVRAIIYKSIAKHFNKQAARVELNKAINRGEVVKPDTCEVCNGTPDRLEAHHADYNKPLNVSWVCSGCHGTLDREMRKKVVQ